MPNEIEVSIWDQCHKLYEDGENLRDRVQKYYDYYLGRFDNPSLYADADVQNTNNIIQPIIETKTTLVLDSNMTTTVLPDIASFENIATIKEGRDIADIYNDCLKRIHKINNMDQLKQRIVRWGEIAGYCAIETVYDFDKGEQGEVSYNFIDPRFIRWDKSAKKIEEANFATIEMQVSPMTLKKKYATNKDGTFNDEMVRKIDSLAKVIKKDEKKSDKKGVISYTGNQGGGQAYGGGGDDSRVQITKAVKLIKVYFKDDTIFTPDQTDDSKSKELKTFFKFKYPKGRVMIISDDPSCKIVFEDKPIEYRFGFPIDIFNPIEIEAIKGKGDVEDLIHIQDRVNKSMERARTLIGKYISTICLDKGYDADITEGDFVNNFVVFVENMAQRGKPEILTNNTIAELKTLTEYIQYLETTAKKIARVNDTMISGIRQTGTTSGAQVEALKEDPQSAIRSIQRQLKDFMISVSNKALVLVQDFYDFQRIIKLTTKIDIGNEQSAEYAKFTEGEIALLDQAGKAVKIIKTNPDILYRCDIVAGTEIPRSRTETATLLEKLFTAGILGDPTDIDVIEEYLRGIDFPNYREFVNMARKKQDAKTEIPMPPADKINSIFQHLPIWAQDQWLEKNGFIKPEMETMETIPEDTTNIGGAERSQFKQANMPTPPAI